MPSPQDVAGSTFIDGGRWRVTWQGSVLPLAWSEQAPAEELLELCRRTMPEVR